MVNVLTAERLGFSVRDKFSAQTTEILSSISLTVGSGEMVAIVGPSGSGKSTLLYCLSGLEQATQGDASLLGTPISRLSPRALSALQRDRVGFVFQKYNLIDSLSAIENVLLPARLQSKQTDAAHARELLLELGVEDSKHSVRASDLSSGQQQRIALARVLYSPPQVLFADEPTGALDVRSSDLVIDCLRKLTAAGTSVVLVTHDLDAASQADRAYVLVDGRITAEVEDPRPDDLLVSFTAGG